MKKILAATLIAASLVNPAFAKGQKVDRDAVITGASILVVAADACPELGLDNGKVQLFAAIAMTQIHADKTEIVNAMTATWRNHSNFGKTNFCAMATQAAIKSGIGTIASK